MPQARHRNHPLRLPHRLGADRHRHPHLPLEPRRDVFRAPVRQHQLRDRDRVVRRRRLPNRDVDGARARLHAAAAGGGVGVRRAGVPRGRAYDVAVLVRGQRARADGYCYGAVYVSGWV